MRGLGQRTRYRQDGVRLCSCGLTRSACGVSEVHSEQRVDYFHAQDLANTARAFATAVESDAEPLRHWRQRVGFTARSIPPARFESDNHGHTYCRV